MTAPEILADRLLHKFESCDAVFHHCMEIMDLAYEFQAFQKIKLYQEALNLTIKKMKRNDNLKWRICPICKTLDGHSKTCLV